MAEEGSIISAAYSYHIFSPGDLVIAAVSGGPDSVAMLHALHTSAVDLGISLHVAHLNHSLRGEESDQDEKFVSDLAAMYGLPCTVAKADIRKLKRSLKTSQEEAARIARYKFLRETLANIGGNKIAVAHTSDDLAETVLLNIVRGSGLDGLVAMRPVTGNVVRPLLGTSRLEVMAYIERHALPYRIDTSNLDPTHTRNRVRHNLLPLLERDYNPQVKAALTRLSEIAAMESEASEMAARRALSEISYAGTIDARLLGLMPVGTACRLIRAAIERAKGDLKDIKYEQVLRVVDSARSKTDFCWILPSGKVEARCKSGLLSIANIGKKTKPIEFDYPLAVPGETNVPETGIILKTEIISEANSFKLPADSAIIDMDKVAGKLRVRSPRPGDRIAPLGLGGHKKLQDVFVDAKVRREKRAQTAVVVDDEKIVWVVGLVSSDQTKASPETRKICKIVAVPLEQNGTDPQPSDPCR